jgi:hypothetical protein
VCGGECGERWKRAILDSHDARLAHWVGHCALPLDEQQRRMIEQATRRG